LSEKKAPAFAAEAEYILLNSVTTFGALFVHSYLTT